MPDHMDIDGAMTPRLLENRAGSQKMQDSNMDVNTFLNAQVDPFARMLVLTPMEWMERKAGPWPFLLRGIPLGAKTGPDCLCNWPDKVTLARWRRDGRVRQLSPVDRSSATPVQSPGAIAKLQLPTLVRVIGDRVGHKHPRTGLPTVELDPLRLLNAVAATTHLRNHTRLRGGHG